MVAVPFFMEPVDGLGPFGDPSPAAAVLAACDGAAPHRPFPADAAGLKACARETAAVAFPRAAVAAAAEQCARARGFGDAALARARLLADAQALAVVTGQQPGAFGGPLYTAYKAATAVALARAAETLLGVPVIPLFWIASEDHDLDEVSAAAAPGPGGTLLRFRADLAPWRGRPAAAVGADGSWHADAARWLATLPAGGDALQALSPRAGEDWTGWFARILGGLFGPLGLVPIEPQALRPLAAPLFARTLREHRAVAALLAESAAERAASEGPPSFASLGGPPLFLEEEPAEGGRRRRILESGGALALRGDAPQPEANALEALLALRPGRFSAHAALRPVLQNALLPVVAQVLGPGELLYQEELYRFHASALGAGRRMPVPWPRLSATILDGRAAATAERFGLAGADLFLGAEDLTARFSPSGALGREARELARATQEKLRALAGRVEALDPTLARPLEKTAAAVEKSLSRLTDKVTDAEARAQGFAPDKLTRLADWVRPGGEAQERVFGLSAALPLFGAGFAGGLVEGADVMDRRHRILRAPSGKETP